MLLSRHWVANDVYDCEQLTVPIHVSILYLHKVSGRSDQTLKPMQIISKWRWRLQAWNCWMKRKWIHVRSPDGDIAILSPTSTHPIIMRRPAGIHGNLRSIPTGNCIQINRPLTLATAKQRQEHQKRDCTPISSEAAFGRHELVPEQLCPLHALHDMSCVQVCSYWQPRVVKRPAHQRQVSLQRRLHRFNAACTASTPPAPLHRHNDAPGGLGIRVLCPQHLLEYLKSLSPQLHPLYWISTGHQLSQIYQ